VEVTRQGAESVEESAARLRLAVESSNTGLWEWNLATNEVYFSPIWKRQLGYEDHEIPARFEEWQNRVHPDDLERVLKAVNDFIAAPGASFENEFRLRHMDGSYRWIMAKSALISDPQGRPLRMLGSHLDITARKQDEAALREKEEKLRQVMDSLGPNTFLGLMTPDGILIEANRAGLAAAEVRREEVLGKPFDQTVWWDHSEPVRIALRAAMTRAAAGESSRYDVQVRVANNTLVWIDFSLNPVCDASGRVIYVVPSANIIDERKKLEEQMRQSQKLEAMGQLAGGIAHDFNNILSTIVGNAELARQDLTTSLPSLTSIQEILRAGQRAKELVQRIVAFSSPHEHELKPMQLQPVVDEAVRLLRATLPAGVELVLHRALALPAVRADASQAHQIILNLATNAWHAIESRVGRIDIQLAACQVDSALCQLHPELHPGSYVRLTVSDTGTGMDAAILGRIFEPFFTTKPSGQGAGLGLSVVHGIVRSHGGAVIVESQLGIGSTFHVYFPECTEAAAPLLSAPPASKAIQGRGEHILYVDDEEALVFLAVRFLERYGYRVDGHTRAAEGVEAFRANPHSYDLVITDYNMPGMSGMEVAQQLILPRFPGHLDMRFNSSIEVLHEEQAS